MVDEVRRRLGDDDVAGVEQQLAEQVEQLLRAGGDDDVVGGEGQVVGADAVGGAGRGRGVFRAAGVALGGAVLQGGAAVAGRRAARRRPGRPLPPAATLVDQPGGEADEARRFQGHPDQRADRRIGRSQRLGRQRQRGCIHREVLSQGGIKKARGFDLGLRVPQGCVCSPGSSNGGDGDDGSPNGHGGSRSSERAARIAITMRSMSPGS